MNFIPSPSDQQRKTMSQSLKSQSSRRGLPSASLASETSQPRTTSYRALGAEEGGSSGGKNYGRAALDNRAGRTNNTSATADIGRERLMGSSSLHDANCDQEHMIGNAISPAKEIMDAPKKHTDDNTNNYENSDEHDEASSQCESDFHKPQDDDGNNNMNDLSPRTRRRQFRELVAASDDCWGADLSDDEFLGGSSPKQTLANSLLRGQQHSHHGSMMPPALPLQWEANMVRREMMKHGNTQSVRQNNSSLFEDDVESCGTDVDIDFSGSLESSASDVHKEKQSQDGIKVPSEKTTKGQKTRNRNRRRSKDNIAHALSFEEGAFQSDATNSSHRDSSSETVELSLPELLLQKRLKRKQKLQKAQAKHEMFVRYQQEHTEQQKKQLQQQQIREGSSPKSARTGGDGSDVDKTVASSSNTQQAKPPSTASSTLSPATESFLQQHLQSAYKSMPRPASPLFPDDDLENNNHQAVDLNHHLSSATSSPAHPSSKKSPLDSLPHRPICPFPEEADRKRIVGCLAAILASSYGYDTVPKLLVRERKKNAKKSEEQACKQGSEQRQGQGLKDGEGSSVASASTLHSLGVDEGNPTSNHQQHHEMNGGRNENTALQPIPQKEFLQKDAAQQEIVLQQRQLQQQQHLYHQKRAQFQANRAHSFQVGSANKVPNNKMNGNGNGIQHAQLFTEGRPANSPRSSSPFSINPSLSLASLTTSFDKPIGWQQNNTPTLSTELAEIRHRIRRHAVLSELLVSSADMLMLDASHAKAFLPMLESLLTKVEDEDAAKKARAGSTNASWAGRGFGGGGVPPAGSLAAGSASIKRSSHGDMSLGGIKPAPTPVVEQQGDLKMSQSTEGIRRSPPTNVTAKLDEHFQNKTKSGNFRSSKKGPPSEINYSPLDTVIVEKDLIAPFLQTLTPGAGFRCIALLLLNHLLRDGRGYDARVRQAFKRLGVVVLSHELKVGGILRVDLEDEDDLDSMLWGEGKRNSGIVTEEEEDFSDADELALLATRKFEAMEHAIAAKLISMSGNAPPEQTPHSPQTSRADRKKSSRRTSSANDKHLSNSTHGRIALAPKESPLSSQHGLSREQLLRGLKIGTAGAVGATLFALTGGLAAPGIAAGLAAVAGGSAVAAGMTTVLSSAAAISTIFGVGGAGLAGYKMHRRTKGLTEFDFQKEGSVSGEAELFSTVCISGWLRDSRDFQRPWGVSPNHPRIIDKIELLERFYFIHNPANVHRCGEILKHWKGRYFQLWRALREKYGRDPSNLFPLAEGPRVNAELTHEESEAVEFLLDELGYSNKSNRSKHDKSSPIARMKADISSADADFSNRSMVSSPTEAKKLQSAQKQLKDSSLKPKGLLQSLGVSNTDVASISTNLSLFAEESDTSSINDKSNHKEEAKSEASSKVLESSSEPAKKPPPKHLLTVWDYHADYGGELYTVRWESELLMELCDSVADQMIEWGISATKTILHTTALATLMTAITLPYSLVVAANAIDNSWAMAMERADRAGIELAKSLIDSTAGHRPVTLVGFSMGARVIYSCLKELARHQEIWEDQQQKRKMKSSVRGRRDSSSKGDDELQYIREPASIIEDAILMGTPNHVSLRSWEACRRVVAGRLINCYSRKDLILSLMFQLKRFQGILRPVCGTSPVSICGIENYDITDLVSAHTDYCLVTGEILKRVKHGQPQRASVKTAEVEAMVTSINVANANGKDAGGFASLSDEISSQRASKHDR